MNTKVLDDLIVVTGAAGMIGSGIVRHLNDMGYYNLILCDRLRSGCKWKNLVGKSYIDIISPDKIFEYLYPFEKSVSAYIHMGACSDTTEQNGDYLLENNFHFTTRLASLALKENKRFIYASSAATYGDGSLGFDDDETQLSSLRPLNMYGYSKHLVDLWMQREGVLKNVVGLKYFNVFGPNEYHKAHMASFVMKMMQKAKSDGFVSLFKSNDPANFSDGEQCRDFIYVKDAVAMTCAFLNPTHQSINGIFNIGSGIATSWNQMAFYLFSALNLSVKIDYVDIPSSISKQYQNYTCANMSKYYSHFLKQKKSSSISSAVIDYVSNYLLQTSHW